MYEDGSVEGRLVFHISLLLLMSELVKLLMSLSLLESIREPVGPLMMMLTFLMLTVREWVELLVLMLSFLYELLRLF